MKNRILQPTVFAVIMVTAVAGFLLSATEPGIAAPGDVIFERQTETDGADSFEPAFFPHWVHRIRYRCDTCHPRIFPMSPGTTPITMDQISRGEVCGECHNGTTAFDVDFRNCSRCHISPE